MAEYIELEVLEEKLKELGLEEQNFIKSVLADDGDYILEDFISANALPVVRGDWKPIINAEEELEGWTFKRCGTETKQKSNYCPSCESRMDV